MGWGKEAGGKTLISVNGRVAKEGNEKDSSSSNEGGKVRDGDLSQERIILSRPKGKKAADEGRAALSDKHSISHVCSRFPEKKRGEDTSAFLFAFGGWGGKILESRRK